MTYARLITHTSRLLKSSSSTHLSFRQSSRFSFFSSRAEEDRAITGTLSALSLSRLESIASKNVDGKIRNRYAVQGSDWTEEVCRIFGVTSTPVNDPNILNFIRSQDLLILPPADPVSRFLSASRAITPAVVSSFASHIFSLKTPHEVKRFIDSITTDFLAKELLERLSAVQSARFYEVDVNALTTFIFLVIRSSVSFVNYIPRCEDSLLVVGQHTRAVADGKVIVRPSTEAVIVIEEKSEFDSKLYAQAAAELLAVAQKQNNLSPEDTGKVLKEVRMVFMIVIGSSVEFLLGIASPESIAAVAFGAVSANAELQPKRLFSRLTLNKERAFDMAIPQDREFIMTFLHAMQASASELPEPAKDN